MIYRVTDSKTDLTTRIGAQRSRIDVLQERLTTGKRINRASDDPNGAEAVLNLRTSQKQIEQFQRSAQTVNTKLTTADNSLESYQISLDRTRSAISQGLTGTTTQEARNVLATELESLRDRILNIANSKSGDEYVFGGTRQNVPPFDPTTRVPAAAPTAAQFVQIEPGSNAIASGVTADKIFSDASSDIFADLTAAAAALRGTGNAANDRATLVNANARLVVYNDAATNARLIVGTNMKTSEIALENLTGNFLSLDEQATNIEGADFAGTALEFADAQRSFEATLQIAASSRRSLFDYLG
ncbi:MAG: flagellar hook-associated protein FlgL [Pyrinomonadaceae bacterium]|nr:flagellar hook-associated protein FlgL [Pyrinomonadaceae bacterium]